LQTPPKPNKKPSCGWGELTVPPVSKGQRPTFARRKKTISQTDCSPTHARCGDATIG